MDGHGDVRRIEQGGSSSLGSSHSQELVVKNTFLQIIETPHNPDALPRSSSDSDLSNSQRGKLRPQFRDSSGSSHSRSRDGPSHDQDQFGSSSSRECSGSSSRESSQEDRPAIVFNPQVDFNGWDDIHDDHGDDSGDEESHGDQQAGGEGGELLSRGSALHKQGKCRPCLFHLDGKDKCKHGADCAFCHELHHKKRKRPKKKAKDASSFACVVNTTGTLGTVSNEVQLGTNNAARATNSGVPLPVGPISAGPLPVGPVSAGYKGPWCTGVGVASSDDEGLARRQASTSPHVERPRAKCIMQL